ncbi:hypothetical protein D3C80_1572540 [compost metagenome]
MLGRTLGIQAALEGEALDVIDAVFAELEVDLQLVLAFSQLITLLVAAPQRTATGFVRCIAADQTALRQIGALAAVIEQLEGHIRTVLPTRVLRQTQFHHIAATWIDSQIQDVGFHSNQLVTDGRWGNADRT